VSPLPVDLGDGAALRRLALDDLDAVWALVDGERDRLRPWLPWVDATRSIDDQRRWLEGVIAAERNLDGCGIFVGGVYAGGAGLTWDQFDVVGEIGYWIGSAHEGKGFVSRATRALIEIAFGELRLHRITIQAAVDNLRSRAIPERLGFTQEGVIRGAERSARGFHDLVVYGLLEDEWPPM
jgi:ribosomal-protein-serine acetyltransferase